MGRILVLGAGVVGMTSAYGLAKKGHKVCVIDAAPGPAEAGASFGNGAQLSYFYTDAMASPSLAANIPKYILGLDPAFRVRMTISPAFMAWGLRFLANATQKAFERNTSDILKLALQSRLGIAELSEKIKFDYSQTGKITLFSSRESLMKAQRLSELKNRYGAGQVVLTRDQALEKEPALAHYGHSFEGAIWSPHDEAGDSSLFCKNLRVLLERDYGVRFLFNTKVRRIQNSRKRARGDSRRVGGDSVHPRSDFFRCVDCAYREDRWNLVADLARSRLFSYYSGSSLSASCEHHRHGSKDGLLPSGRPTANRGTCRHRAHRWKVSRGQVSHSSHHR